MEDKYKTIEKRINDIRNKAKNMYIRHESSLDKIFKDSFDKIDKVMNDDLKDLRKKAEDLKKESELYKKDVTDPNFICDWQSKNT